MIYIYKMNHVIVGLRFRVMALFFYFYPFFFLKAIVHVYIKICVGVFSDMFKARMLKLSIHMDNELLYCGIENRTPFFIQLSLFYTVELKWFEHLWDQEN